MTMPEAWQWFSANSIWILMASALALALLVFGRPRIHARLESVSHVPRRLFLQRAADSIIVTLDTLVLVVIAAGAIAITLSREGPGALITPESIKLWAVEHGLIVLLIAAISYLVFRLIKSAIPSIVERSMSSRGRGRKAREDLARRVQTLSGALVTVTAIVVLIAAIFMILAEVGVDVTPLLATAGVAGIAIGLGAQSLIKDMIAGLFILMEDQYNKGDVVKVAGIAGQVEDVTLKRTVLRDLDGIVHSIPNGEITTASNYTKEYSRLNLDVPVAYGEDLDHCIDVINRVGQELAKDPAWGPKIRSAPQSLGVNKFGDSGIDIKVLGDTKPMMQWEVTREYRRRIKKAFDEEGIEIPWPHIKLYHGEPKKGSTVTCPSCGKPNVKANLFCAACGSPMKAEPANPAAGS
jgi:small-conductance mechanosensitive channel